MWVPSRPIENRATLDSTTANIVLCADAELWHPMAAVPRDGRRTAVTYVLPGRRKQTPREPVPDRDKSECGEVLGARSRNGNPSGSHPRSTGSRATCEKEGVLKECRTQKQS